jgi:outer membrane protein assembly factor BamB
MGPHFYCLDAQTGKALWHFAPENIWSTNTSPAVCGGRVILMAFHYKGYQGHPYEIWTYCLRADTGALIWKFPAGGLNGPVIAKNRVFFGSTERGKYWYYCLDLEGNGDGTTTCLWKIPLGFTVLESCTAVTGQNAYVYAEDGYLYAIE